MKMFYIFSSESNNKFNKIKNCVPVKKKMWNIWIISLSPISRSLFQHNKKKEKIFFFNFNYKNFNNNNNEKK